MTSINGSIAHTVGVNCDLRRIGRRMPRRRGQDGSLSNKMPASGNSPRRALPRGTWYAEWRQYVRTEDGREIRKRRSKVFDRELAEKHGIAKDYKGPLTKTDAQKVLAILIAEDTGVFIKIDRANTFGMVAREYLTNCESGWGEHMIRTGKHLIEHHLISGALGQMPVRDITPLDCKAFLNPYISAGRSSSLIKKIARHMRAIFDHAIARELIRANPARHPIQKLKARSKVKESKRFLTLDECRRLLAELSGADHLIVRMMVQLGLRPEEQFALRVSDVHNDRIRVNQTVIGTTVQAGAKTPASTADVYLPPELATEVTAWLEQRDGGDSLLFPGPRRGHPRDPHNFLNRVLKPAAIRAKIGVRVEKNRKGKEVERTDVNFQVLRRTCATHFGRHASARDTQAQLRHADPTVTLKHYQQAIPESVQNAAALFEADLFQAVVKGPVN